MKPLLLALLTLPGVFAEPPAVEVRRLPPGAVQPVAITEAGGDVHLVWLQGEPKAADVYYQKLPGGRTNGSAPIRVNHQPGSAIAIGTIRGAQIAIGRQGRIHLAWNGSSAVQSPANAGVALWYTHGDETGRAFEPERNLMGKTVALDGGASVAADPDGRVYVVWHAAPDADHHAETARRVFLARSTDDGKTFAAERPVSPPNGACGCCGLRSATDRSGNLLVLYRSAPAVDQRDMTLLVSRDQGTTFLPVLTDPWPTGQCPMSSAACVAGPAGVGLAWETKGQVFGSFGTPAAKAFTPAIVIAPTRGSKHPALASNAAGESLAVWSEGTGWQKGGQVAWRSLDTAGRLVGETTIAPGLPVWSSPAAFARDDGRFVVLF